MVQKFSIKFRGREAEVVKAVHDFGIDECMLLYGVKNKPTFIAWLRDYTGKDWVGLHPLGSLSGGEKAKLIRDHRNTILDELEVFGKDWVLINWQIDREEILDRFISFDNPPFVKRLTELERAKLDAKEALRIARETKKAVDTFIARLAIVEEERRTERQTVTELQKAYNSFTKIVSDQLSQSVGQFFKAILDHSIKPDENLLPLPEPDLSIDGLLNQGRKWQLKNGVVEATPDNPLLETVARTKTLARRGN